MTPSEIIISDQFTQEDGAEQVVSWIKQHVEDGLGILLKKNESVLFILLIAPKTVEIHLYTRDTPLRLVSAVKYFYEQLKASDIERVYGTTPRTPRIVDLIKVAGVEVKNSDNPKYSWMADV
jgi:hypothetical protein